MSLEFIKYDLLRSDEKLLYLIYFGSHLYGTYDENSDVDYKGLFLPSKKDLLLMNGRKSINWKSGNNESKNSSEDVDVELWSVHHFIELIKKGDTGAIDLLYSITNNEAIAYLNNYILELFENPLKLFDPTSVNSYTEYSANQAKKYGVKGSRLGVLKRIYYYLKENVSDYLMNSRLSVIAPDILDNFYDKSFCFYKNINNEDALVIAGKTHIYSIRIKEFFHRIEREYKKYGKRSEMAMNNEGLDYKALSHAIRCIEQTKELLRTGKIVYPLISSPFIKEVKDGKYSWQFIENYIVEGLNEVDKLRETGIKGEHDQEFVNHLILKLYREV